MFAELLVLTASSPAEAVRDVYRNGNGVLQIDDSQATFEEMFRAAAVRLAPVVDTIGRE